jgi:hypothetical protein
MAALWVLCVTLDRYAPNVDRSPYGACDVIARGLTYEQCGAELRGWLYRAVEWEERSHIRGYVFASCLQEEVTF